MNYNYSQSMPITNTPIGQRFNPADMKNSNQNYIVTDAKTMDGLLNKTNTFQPSSSYKAPTNERENLNAVIASLIIQLIAALKRAEDPQNMSTTTVEDIPPEIRKQLNI